MKGAVGVVVVDEKAGGTCLGQEICSGSSRVESGRVMLVFAIRIISTNVQVQ